MSKEALPCIICSKPLRNVDEDLDNQPYGGTEFIARGHYGSTIHDPIGEDNPLVLVANICDTCILRACEKGIIQSRTEGNPLLDDEAILSGWKSVSMAMEEGEKDPAVLSRIFRVAIRHSGSILLSRHPISVTSSAWVRAQNEREYGSAWGEDEPVDYDALMEIARGRGPNET